jgi:ubiquinone/menaquinone biosynthesis C-methylase UbiE
MTMTPEQLRAYGYRMDRQDRDYIQKLQEIIPVVNGWVLDVGCGEGSIAAELTTNKNIVGLDIDGARVKKAKSKLRKLDFIVADVYHMPFKAACLELVVAIQIVEHVPSDRGFLQEINRIVTNGGFISISTPNRYRVSNLPRLLYNRVLGRASYPYDLGGSLGQYARIHLREYTLSELRYIMTPEFTVILSFEYILGYGNYCLPMSRPKFLCYMLFALGKKA